MLWDVSVIRGYAIEATDGQLGTVSDFLFEDDSWIVRWLVVDTGDWLSGRKVLLPHSVLEKPDRALRQFPVKLTMQKVEDSPDLDTDRPVSRQIGDRNLRLLRLEPVLEWRLFPSIWRDVDAICPAALLVRIITARSRGFRCSSQRCRSPSSQHRSPHRIPRPCHRRRNRSCRRLPR